MEITSNKTELVANAESATLTAEVTPPEGTGEGDYEYKYKWEVTEGVDFLKLTGDGDQAEAEVKAETEGTAGGSATVTLTVTVTKKAAGGGMETGGGDDDTETETDTQAEETFPLALKDDCTIKVTYIPATGITLDKDTIPDLKIRGTAQLTATVTPEKCSDEVEWESDRESVATVDKSGKVTGVGLGTATITAKAGEKSAVCRVTVSYAAAAKVEIPASETIRAGERRTVSAVVKGPDDGAEPNPNAVLWQIIDRDDVISIDRDRGSYVIVTGNLPGEAVLTAAAEGAPTEGAPTVRDSCKITVPGIQIVHKDQEVLKKVIDIPLGGQATFTVKGYGDASSGSPTWTSSSVGIATFTNAVSGTLVGQSVGGPIEITAKLGEYTCTAWVRVVENTANVIDTGVRSGGTLVLDTLSSKLRDVYAEAMDGIVSSPNRNDLSYLTSLSVPTSQGVLYYDYVSPDNHGYGVGSAERYYLSPSAGSRGLGDVTFVPAAGFTGQASITYTGYDRNGRSYSGTVRVSVSGGSDVEYTSVLGEPVLFDPDDFNDVYRAKTGRDVRYVSFALPDAKQGTLYYQYVAQGQFSGLVYSGERYGRSSAPWLDRVSFVPAEGFSGTVRINYYVQDTANVTGKGVVTVTVTANQGQTVSTEVSYTAAQGEDVKFSSADFSSACRAVLEEELDYVYFTPPDSALGTLWYRYSASSARSRVTETTRYYQTNSSTRPGVGGVYFVPNSSTVGAVSIPYTAYSRGGHRYSGTVTISYTGVGEGEVRYKTRAGIAVQFESADFNEICLSASGESFSYVKFDALPSAYQGELRYNYYSATSKGSSVSTSTRLYRATSSPSLSRVAFIPSISWSGTLWLPFTAYSSGGTRVFNGTLVVEVESSGNLVLSYTGYSGRAMKFPADDLDDICRSYTGRGLNYVRFTLPSTSQGRLYYRYGATSQSALSASTSYYYSGSGRTVSDVSFVPASGFTGRVELSYTAVSLSGTQYTAAIVVTVLDPVARAITRSTGSLPVYFSNADFDQACGGMLDGGLSYIQFTTMPAASQGKLYVGYSLPGTGSQAAAGVRYHYSGTPGISQLTFVPKAGYSGRVSLNYTAYNSRGETVTGTVVINVTQPTTTTRFRDMNGYSWAAASVDYLGDVGIVQGDRNRDYKPGGPMIRAEFVQLVCQAFNFNTGSVYSFPDVPQGSYYGWAVATAKDLGFAQAGTDGLYHPTEQLQRQEAMAILYGAMKAAGWSLPRASYAVLNNFEDGDRVSSSYREAVAVMVQIGLVQGDGAGGYLRPEGTMTRAEMAVLIHRAMTL
ncbi:MAG: S-layer homology domain-containing protein [Roseburia sp.]|nr:S-layer homology domain-containing protein [Roseburia sp.]